jgi:hypothetical protein
MTSKAQTPEESSGGMFDKDKEIGNRIDGAFELGEPFILWDAAVAPELVKTDIGDARKTLLEVSRLDSPDEHFACVTLASAIADKAALAVPADFPAVVELRRVKGRFGDNLALVIQYVRDYEV